MKRKSIIVSSILVLTLLLSIGIAFADDFQNNDFPQSRYGWKLGFGRDNIQGGSFAYTIDKDDLVTIKGKLKEDIDFESVPYRMIVAIDNDKTVDVHLGRIVFYDEFKNLNVKKGSDVEITGIYRALNINNEDVSIFIPFTIKANDKEINLRDEYNRPIWAGRNRRNNTSQRFGRGYGPCCQY
jgi:hypothetical protein